MLCRLALANHTIDATSFTLIRLVSGALILSTILFTRQSNNTVFHSGSWLSALALFIYAAGFSYGYIDLDTGTGALVLFTCVQITMIVVGILRGQHPTKLEWLGLLSAFAGFIYLISPGVTAPSLSGVLLMSLAGMAWGWYSLLGAKSATPLQDTAANFVKASLLSVMLVPILFVHSQIQLEGVVYAILSGTLTSGIGYAIWYQVLPYLRANIAAVCQLSVPIIAALGGILLLNETFSIRLLVASISILGGIILVIKAKQFTKSKT
ncbi:DMT family transporter [Aliiglaciecola sp. LCG003]|uniref:DMT family transporter n=1 Tax=Aliiglaciecola sp. LCG003 TaxID=3053655 RepID=UPI0033657678